MSRQYLENKKNIYYSTKLMFSLIFAVSFISISPDNSLAQSNLDNQNTGSESINSNIINIDTGYTVSQKNTANTNNTVVITTNSGNNNISQNTTVGSIKTGDQNIELEFINKSNILPEIMIPSVNNIETLVSSNNTTGANSQNKNIITIDNHKNINQENDSNVSNSAIIDANSGDNTITGNTKVGDITTGEINIKLVFDNTQNQTIVPAKPVTPIPDQGSGSDTVVDLLNKLALAPKLAQAGLGGANDQFFQAGSANNYLPLILSLILISSLMLANLRTKLTLGRNS